MIRWMVPVALGALLSTGCLSARNPNGIAVETVSCTDVRMDGIVVERDDGTLSVRGRLNPRPGNPSGVGRVEVFYYNAAGGLLTTQSVEPSPSMFMRKTGRRPAFETRLREGAEAVAAVRIVHQGPAEIDGLP